MHRPGTFSGILVALSLLAAAVPASGEDPPAPDAAAAKQEAVKQAQARRVKRWDADGNGVLDPKELAAEKEARKRRIAANKDRSAPATEAFEKERQALVEKYDRDGDGRLSKQELTALRADHAAASRTEQRERAQAGAAESPAAREAWDAALRADREAWRREALRAKLRNRKVPGKAKAGDSH